jgi:hypothetical protein
MRRIRHGETLVAVGTIGLFVALFADWFSGGGVSQSGWSSLGWALIVLIVALLATAVVMVVTTIAKAKPAIVVGSGVILSALSIVTLIVALLRVLLFQPALDMGLGNEAVSIEAAGYLGLLALIAITAGAWLAMGDERTQAPDSAYAPPPPRPVPGA